MNDLKVFLLLMVLLASGSQVWGGNRDFDLVISGTKESPRILACVAPEFAFHLPQMAGNLRLGFSNGKINRWGSDLKNVTALSEKEKVTYTLKDPMFGRGSVTVRVTKLSDTDGIAVEIRGEQLPPGTQVVWSFGGCYGKVINYPIESRLRPEYCYNNVFSVEDTNFTVYYGESMDLQTIQGITPFNSDIRLADATEQETPMKLFLSGKEEIEAPALGGTNPLENHNRLYYCIYTQNKKAEYNYYILPSLFKKEFNKR